MLRLLTALFALALTAGACSNGGNAPTFSGGGTTSTTEVVETTSSTSTTTIAPAVDPTVYAERGEFAVGVITLDLGDRLAEVYYPANPTESAATEIFDSLSVFPADLRALIPDELSGLIDTNAYRNAAPTPDAPSTGFPIVVYSHGFGSYRQAATALNTHVASWGHVVISVDHLERGLAAQATNSTGGGAEDQDVLDMFAGIEATLVHPLLGPLADGDRIVITGHSAGGWAAATAAADPRVAGFISVAAGSPEEVTQKPALVVIAERDGVVRPGDSYDFFELLDNAALVNIADAGHNSFTDSCRRIRDLGGLGDLADLIGADQAARGEDGCTRTNVEPEAAQAVLGHYTVAFVTGLFGDTEPLVDITTFITVDDIDPEDGGMVEPALIDFRVNGDPLGS